MKYAAVSYTRAPLAQGYTDRVLKIDLSRKSITIEPISQDVKKAYVGGRGYCLKLVYDGTTAATRYDSPENVLALSGGPFCGETELCGDRQIHRRHDLAADGTFCDSNVGGPFLSPRQDCGFDAIAVTGKSADAGDGGDRCGRAGDQYC